MRGKSALIAAVVLFGGIALSAILIQADFVLLGVVVGFSALPAAFTALVSAGDKYY